MGAVVSVRETLRRASTSLAEAGDGAGSRRTQVHTTLPPNVLLQGRSCSAITALFLAS